MNIIAYVTVWQEGGVPRKIEVEIDSDDLKEIAEQKALSLYTGVSAETRELKFELSTRS
jgi:hypothetical protein